MESVTRLIWTIISFIVPLIGVILYFAHKSKNDAKLFGMIGMVGMSVYILCGLGFI